MTIEHAWNGNRFAVAVLFVLLIGTVLPVALATRASAAPVLAIDPITWNVIGLDSNDVTVGPNVFPVGARVCNTGDVAATNVTVDFVWDSNNALINLNGASGQTLTTLAPTSCEEFDFEVVITRSAAAYDTARSYHITVGADGIGSASTPSPREVYVEHLVSQARNKIISISGPTTVFVGQTYTYTLVASTATNGYEQLENFITFPNVIFRVEAVDTTYSAPAGETNDKVYADACGWDNDPLSLTYRSCVGPENYLGGKAGGDITTTYTVTILSTGSADLTSLIYDFSGSSYHYNSDFGVTVRSVTAVNAPPPAADLSITKTDSVDPVVTGADLDYTLSVTNAGPSDASSVEVTDALPAGTSFVSASGTGWTCANLAGTVTCTRPALAAGVTAPDITVTVTAPSSAGTISNTATVGATENDPSPADNSDSEETTVQVPPPPPAADLSITKTDSVDPVVTGADFDYTLSVTNAGPSDASSVEVTDVLPAGTGFVSASGTGWACADLSGTVTCTRPLLASGATAPDITIAVTAPSTMGTVTNTATVSAAENDPTPADNSDSEDTTVQAPPPPPAADLSITKTDSVDPVVTGANLSYALSVANAGPSDASAVSVIDQLPAGTGFVSATGAGWTCAVVSGTVTCSRASLVAGTTAPDIMVAVTAPASEGPITNSATVSAAENDPNPSDNSDSEDTTVEAPPPPPPVADLSITKTDSQDPVTAGANLSYSLSVTNTGPSDASALSVTDPLPAGTSLVSATGKGWSCGNLLGTVTCTRDSLTDGATASDITVMVTAPGSPGMISNTAAVSAAEVDPTPANNSDSEDTTVQAVSAGGAGNSPQPKQTILHAAPRPALALTGAPTDLVALIGLLLMVSGSLMTYISRRHRSS